VCRPRRCHRPARCPAQIPADLDELQTLGDLGESIAWGTDQYVVLGDGSEAHWDGDSWEAGRAP